MSFKVTIDFYGDGDDLSGDIVVDMINVKPVSIVWKLNNSIKYELLNLSKDSSSIIEEENNDGALRIYEMNKNIVVEHNVFENYFSYSSLKINFTSDQIEDIIKYEKYFFIYIV